MTRRLVSRPRREGIGPVTRPGKMMSCVNSVRLVREGEREPARPGEPESPVPRVRVVTRFEEQVRPEKVEQGSGEVKSQVDKKSVPGMSVSVDLIDASAAKSTASILSVSWRERGRTWRKMRRGRRVRCRGIGDMCLICVNVVLLCVSSEFWGSLVF